MRFAAACAVSFVLSNNFSEAMDEPSVDELASRISYGFSAPEQTLLQQTWADLCQKNTQASPLTILGTYYHLVDQSMEALDLVGVMQSLGVVPFDRWGELTRMYDSCTQMKAKIPLDHSATTSCPLILTGSDRLVVMKAVASVCASNPGVLTKFEQECQVFWDKATEDFNVKKIMDNTKKHLLLLDCLSDKELSESLADVYALKQASTILGQVWGKTIQSVARIYTCSKFTDDDRSGFMSDCELFFNDFMPRSSVIDTISAFAVVCREDTGIIQQFAHMVVTRNLGEDHKVGKLDAMRELLCIHTYAPSEELLAFQKQFFSGSAPYANISTMEAFMEATQSMKPDQWEGFEGLYRYFFRAGMDGNDAAKLIRILAPVVTKLDAAGLGDFQSEAEALTREMDRFKAMSALEDLAVLHCALPDEKERGTFLDDPLYQAFYAEMRPLDARHMMSRLARLTPIFEAMDKVVRVKISGIWNESKAEFYARQQPEELGKLLHRYQLNQVKKALPAN